MKTRFLALAVLLGCASLNASAGRASPVEPGFTLEGPQGVAVDDDGNLYIADMHDYVIRKIDHASGKMSVVAGNGVQAYDGDGRPAVAASLQEARRVAVDGAGNLYIPDYYDYVIRKVDHASGIIGVVAGNRSEGYDGDGGPAVYAQLRLSNRIPPHGAVAPDGGGNLYIADSANNRIRKVDAAGRISAVAGNGSDHFSGDHGPATEAGLGQPSGVAVGADGKLYISIYEENCVRVVDQSSGTIRTVAGACAKAHVNAYAGDEGLALAAKLNGPSDIALDRAGNLYINDTGNHRIRKVEHATGIITTIAGDGSLTYCLDEGIATRQGINAGGIAVDKMGNVYFAETAYNVIRKIDPAGNISTVPGSGATGLPKPLVQLADAQGVAYDSRGNMYIADAANSRVRKIDRAGHIVTVAGNGVDGFSGDGGPATAAQLNYPSGLAIDATDNLYIADVRNLRIRKVDVRSGIIVTVAGGGEGGFDGSGNSGLATNAQLYGAASVALDRQGNLFIADKGNNRILKVDTKGMISTVAGSGLRQSCGDGKAATLADLMWPEGVAVNAEGDLFIARIGDTLNSVEVRKVDHASGKIHTVLDNTFLKTCPSDGPSSSAGRYPVPGATDLAAIGMAVDRAGNVFVIDRDRYDGPQLIKIEHDSEKVVKLADLPAMPRGLAIDSDGNFDAAYLAGIFKLDAKTGTLNLAVGGMVPGYSGDNDLSRRLEPPGSLAEPRGVTIDAGGNLYIVDTNNNRIRKIDGRGDQFEIAGNGTPGNDGNQCHATRAQLNRPRRVAVDAQGNLFIADTENKVVRKVDHATGIISTIAVHGLSGEPTMIPSDVALDATGNLYIVDRQNRVIRVDLKGNVSNVAGTGSRGFSGDHGPAAGAQLAEPQGIAIDGKGNIYIADTENHRIRKVEHVSGIMTTVAGSGVKGYGGDNGHAADAQLNSPRGIAMDRDGNLYIADSANHRIRKVDGKSGLISTVAGTVAGDYGPGGDGGPAENARLYFPASVAVDAGGNLYIADTGNQVIRKVDNTGKISTVYGKYYVILE